MPTYTQTKDTADATGPWEWTELTSGGGSPKLSVAIHSDASANITLTNQVSTVQFLANSNRNITRVDLTGFTQIRLVARVITGSASVNSPKIYLRYATSFSTNTASYLQLGESAEVEASLVTAGMADSGWVNIAPGAIGDIFLTCLQSGGDGVADPALGMVNVQMR